MHFHSCCSFWSALPSSDPWTVPQPLTGRARLASGRICSPETLSSPAPSSASSTASAISMLSTSMFGRISSPYVGEPHDRFPTTFGPNHASSIRDCWHGWRIPTIDIEAAGMVGETVTLSMSLLETQPQQCSCGQGGWRHRRCSGVALRAGSRDGGGAAYQGGRGEEGARGEGVLLPAGALGEARWVRATPWHSLSVVLVLVLVPVLLVLVLVLVLLLLLLLPLLLCCCTTIKSSGHAG